MFPHPEPSFRLAPAQNPHGGGVPLPADSVAAPRLAAPILVVEDEMLIAMDLTRQIEDDGGAVIGPAESPRTALSLLAAAPDIGGAILDVKLGGETVFAVAEALEDRGIPFVFYTGHTDSPRAYLEAPRVVKPAGWPEIKRALFGPARPVRAEVVAALPALRHAARILAGDDEAGDRLVERVLERAAAEIETRYAHATVADWLTQLLKRVDGGGVTH